MAVSHPAGSGSANVRDDLAAAIRDAIDGGAGAGSLVLKTSGGAEVATLGLSSPCGTVSTNGSGTLTFDTISSDEEATGGTMAEFDVCDSDGNVVWSGTVSGNGGGGEIEFDNVVVNAGATVSVDSLTYTAAP